MVERKEKHKFEQLQMLSTLSPGGKIQWVTPGQPPQGPLANPFIEKSDIVNHKNRFNKIDQKREMIQTMYKGQQTWAQFEHQKNQIRDKYFEEKMNDKFSKIDADKIYKIQRRKEKTYETTEINKQLVTQRSRDKLIKLEDEQKEDQARLEKDRLIAQAYKEHE